jgi:hypothetical protein
MDLASLAELPKVGMVWYAAFPMTNATRQSCGACAIEVNVATLNPTNAVLRRVQTDDRMVSIQVGRQTAVYVLGTCMRCVHDVGVNPRAAVNKNALFLGLQLCVFAVKIKR